MTASGITAAWQSLFNRIADGVQSEGDEQQMLDLLVESGQLTADKAKPELYADPSYQQKAMAGK